MAALRHGLARSGSLHPLYKIWAAMKQRCGNQSSKDFYLYGARGILVCERWRNSFPAFVADVGYRPAGMSLDRIDSDGNYEPGNVRWATAAEQSRNRRPWKHKGNGAHKGRLL